MGLFAIASTSDMFGRPAIGPASRGLVMRKLAGSAKWAGFTLLLVAACTPSKETESQRAKEQPTKVVEAGTAVQAPGLPKAKEEGERPVSPPTPPAPPTPERPSTPPQGQLLRDAERFVASRTAKAGGALVASGFAVTRVEVDPYERDLANAVVSYRLSSFKGAVQLSYQRADGFWKLKGAADLGLK